MPFHVTISGEHEGFTAVPGFGCRVVASAGEAIAEIPLDSLSDEAAAVVVEIYRRAGVWKLRTLCQGWTEGLAAVVRHYGVEVGDQAHSPPEETSGSPANREPASASVPPTYAEQSSGANGELQQPPRAEMLRPPVMPGRRGLFGPRRKDLQQEVVALQEQLASVGALDAVSIRGLIDSRKQELAAIEQELLRATAELDSIRRQIVLADDLHGMQDVGIYEFAHPLDDAVAYKERLTHLRDRYKFLAKSGSAVRADTSWHVNGSYKEGQKMVRDMSKLMLRAYNAEADACVKVVRPHSVQSNISRLERARGAIAKLGTMMSISIASEYHLMRVDELRLTADYHAKVEAEKEAQRAERERLREEQRAVQELNRERAKLEGQRAQLERALQVAQSGDADPAVVSDLRRKLAAVEEGVKEVDARVANKRAGFVYVISNVGAFGPNMVKIGMTRRQDPMDRVRELGDASVPFKFDDHALVFSEDALGLESRLHAAFADRRVNKVNQRREFFYVGPAEVRAKLAEFEGEHLLAFREDATADEWRRSGSRDLGWREGSR